MAAVATSIHEQIALAERWSETGRQVSEALVERGVLCKDYHATLRVAPPLVITREEIDFGVDAIAEVLG
jgi:ornithine--oxo-acid transaminase